MILFAGGSVFLGKKALPLHPLFKNSYKLGFKWRLFGAVIVCLLAPKVIRLNRISDRAYALFGEKSLENGEFYEQIKSFYSFCELRDEKTVEDWLASIERPIIRLDGTLQVDTNVDHLLRFITYDLA